MRSVIFYFISFVLLVSCVDEDANPNSPSIGESLNTQTIINDTFEGRPVVVFGSPENRSIISYYRQASDGTVLEFQRVFGAQDYILGKDQEGNVWNVFGEAISGQRHGEKLSPTQSVNSYWFTISSTFPGIEIYTEDPIEATPPVVTNSEWCVPIEYVNQGTVTGAIPAINTPTFDRYTTRDLLLGNDYLKHDALVTVVKNGGEVKVYPHSILNYHEIVNDELMNGEKIAVLFCPLAGSSTVWNREVNNQEVQFAVSGFLYNNDLIAIDSETGSGWLQLTGKCIVGNNIHQKVERIKYFDTTWGSLYKLFPDTDIDVLNTATGYNYDYSHDPFENYKTDNDFLSFPVSFTDSRLPNKEIVHSIISENQKAKTYRFTHF